MGGADWLAAERGRRSQGTAADQKAVWVILERKIVRLDEVEIRAVHHVNCKMEGKRRVQRILARCAAVARKRALDDTSPASQWLGHEGWKVRQTRGERPVVIRKGTSNAPRSAVNKAECIIGRERIQTKTVRVLQMHGAVGIRPDLGGIIKLDDVPGRVNT